MKNQAKRYIIIGLPGSGKSTFAAQLGKILGIPVHHLDTYVFEGNGQKRDLQERDQSEKSDYQQHKAQTYEQQKKHYRGRPQSSSCPLAT